MIGTITLTELQKEVRVWQERNFPGRAAWEPVMGVSEEVGELSHAHLKEHQKIRQEEDHVAAARDAVGDIVVFLADYCNARGFSLQWCLDEAWSRVKERDWKKYREERSET